jgi:hypothetical protein
MLDDFKDLHVRPFHVNGFSGIHTTNMILMLKPVPVTTSSKAKLEGKLALSRDSVRILLAI